MKAKNYLFSIKYSFEQSSLTLKQFSEIHGLSINEMDSLLKLAESSGKPTSKIIDQIKKWYFQDEFGNWLSGHPDDLAVQSWEILRTFPECDFDTIPVYRRGSGYNLKDGIYLFPSNSFFTEIITLED